MKITVNGEKRILNINSLNLYDLIEQLKYHPKLIVVEYNGKILPPNKWRDQQVKDEDTLEIVTIVGGGA